MTTPQNCRYCGGGNLATIARTSGPHHAQIKGADCGRGETWLKKVWSPERARSFVLGFGKHRGRAVGELATADPDYLRWLATIEGDAAKAARIVLGQVPGEADR
jgi:hypothetical protein